MATPVKTRVETGNLKRTYTKVVLNHSSKELIKEPDFSNMKSSFKGHTVNALVLTGDEGRGQLR